MTTQLLRRIAALLPVVFTLAAQDVSARDVITQRTVSMELARDLAQAAVDSCRGDGWQVSAVVVNRAGDVQVVLRDSLASRYTLQIAREKAEAVILSGVASADFRRNREDIRMEMNHVRGILMLEGGVPIRAGGALIGALGVSGAPGGEKDERCALAALEQLRERLEFAD